ncbi:MAG: WhiB family transcriptional regulator [Egibacteraceae bacterium]
MAQGSNAGRHTWRRRAACLDVPTEEFFPIGTTGPSLEQERRAKTVCAGCEVAARCLAAALAANESGVWGGTNEDERRLLRRKRRGQRWADSQAREG